MIRENLVGLQNSHRNWRELLDRSGIREEELDDPARRIPINKAVRLHRLALDALDDETLGLLNKRTPRGFLRQLALSSVHTGTLNRAVVRMTELANLMENCFRYSAERRNGRTILNICRTEALNLNSDFIVGWLMTIIHRFLGWLANERVVPTEIHFDFQAPQYHREFYYAFYGAPIHYESGQVSIVFRTSDLELPIVQNESSVERYIRRYPLDLLIPVEIGGQLSREVRRRAIESLMRNREMPRIDEIADLMDKHPRTLRRQLKVERTSYKRLTMQIRRDVAMYHLGQDDISVEQIAERAGYSDTSSFIRVFKSWTGFTPLAFRKGL